MKKINWPDQILNFIGVIIGVSLAFLINNTAENKQEKEQFKIIVKSFIAELEDEIKSFEGYAIPTNKRQSAQLDTLMILIEKKEYEDMKKFGEVIGFRNYSPSITTFKSIGNTGKINLIKDFELRKEIINYYTLYAPETKFKNDRQIAYHSNFLLPFIIKNVDITRPDINKIPFAELKNILAFYRIVIDEKIGSYEYAVERAKLLKEKLEKLDL
ncbi:MAG: hypothetical protein AAFQ94_06420 [Bacteroidota bacterium]